MEKIQRDIDEKRICIEGLLYSEIINARVNTSDSSLTNKGEIYNCVIISSLLETPTYNHFYKKYLIKVNNDYFQVSEKTYKTKFISLADYRQNQIDSIIN